MNFIKSSKNEKELNELLEEESDFYSNMDPQEAYLLEIATGIEIEQGKNAEGGINMRKAAEQLKENWRNEGRQEGRQEGQREGENRMAQLTKCLIDANRLDELKKITVDTVLRNLLFEEFHI